MNLIISASLQPQAVLGVEVLLKVSKCTISCTYAPLAACSGVVDSDDEMARCATKKAKILV
jgi:hypothetical protein